MPKTKIWEYLNKRCKSKLTRVTKYMYKETRSCIIKKYEIRNSLQKREGKTKRQFKSIAIYCIYQRIYSGIKNQIIEPLNSENRNLERTGTSKYAFTDSIHSKE